MSQIWNLVLIWTKALKWSQISPSSARKSQISFQTMLRSLGWGLGLETFAKFLRVSVSVTDNLVSEKKVSVSVSENLVSGKKYWFRFRKNLVSEKSLGFGFRKFGIGKNVSIGFGQNFGIVIQCTRRPRSNPGHWRTFWLTRFVDVQLLRRSDHDPDLWRPQLYWTLM